MHSATCRACGGAGTSLCSTSWTGARVLCGTARMRSPMVVNRNCCLALAATSAVFCSALPASAARFDGYWNMHVETTRGHCGPVEIGLAISRGRIFSTSGSFAFYPIRLGGRVSESGQARISAVAGPRVAHGGGRFSYLRGSGTWAGRGPSGLCSGVWTVSRA